MRLNTFEDLKELLIKKELVELTHDELQERVKKVFKRSLEQVKGDYRPTLNVGKKFLQDYYRENGMVKFKAMLSKISLLVDTEGYDYLVELGIVKKKL